MLRTMLFGVAVAVCTFAGCGSPVAPPLPVDEKQTVLEEVYPLLQIPESQGKPPARRIEDLYNYENAYPRAYDAIQKGEVVVNWRVRPAGGDGILAYSKGTDASGGWVLLQNGSVQQMTADEFKATPKAK